MSQTLKTRGNGIRDSSESQGNLKYATEYARSIVETEKRERVNADNKLREELSSLKGKVHTHDNKTVLDRITQENVDEWNGFKSNLDKEIKDRKQTDSELETSFIEMASELESELQEDISKLEGVADKAYMLSDLKARYANNRYTADDIPLAKLFVLTNDTRASFSFFQDADEYGTALSEAIPPNESRVCVKVTESAGGADPTNGYVYVLNDGEVKKLISNLSGRINTEAEERKAADKELEKKIGSGGGENLTKQIDFKSYSLPEPYLRDIWKEDTAADFDLSGMFTVNGVQCGTMTETTVNTGNGVVPQYIIVSFNVETYEIAVSSDSAAVEETQEDGVWTFTYAKYFVPIIENEDPDDPNVGAYKIASSATWDWEVPIGSSGGKEYGYLSTEYNPIAELHTDVKALKTEVAALKDELGTLSSQLDSLNGE